MHTNRILLVVTSADHLGLSPTGVWLEEVAAPYYTFLDAKCDVTIASPLGGETPLDPTGMQEAHQTASTRRFEYDVKAQHALKHTLKLSAINVSKYDAVYFAGGHGSMADFPRDEHVRHTVEAFYRDGKPVASVCHGVACLVDAKNIRGEPIIKSHYFTCFSDEEERSIGGENTVPFLLESKLISLGGVTRTSKPHAPHIVVDRQILTGQNPASSIPLAESVIHELRNKTGGIIAA